METPDLIYCANGNKRFAGIAIEVGFLYGAQLPGTVYHWPYFADQNWKVPNRERYMAALTEHRPYMASVLDLEREEQLVEVLDWVEETAQFVQIVIIIPKVLGIIEQLPHSVAGADVRLGYSVPTRYGGTHVPVWEFAGWPVHLLGGSPQRQMSMCYYLDVRSVDGNMQQLMATRHCQFWVNGTARYAVNRYWPTMREANGGKRLDADDLPYKAFHRSCINIMSAWRSRI